MDSKEFRILLLEDEPTLGQEIGHALRKDGYLVQHLVNGLDAQRVLFDDTPDLAIFDIMVPGIDGLAVGKQAKQTFGVPVIFITARNSPADRVRGLDLGADDYIAKPFLMAELLLRVRNVLGRNRAESVKIDIAGLVIDLGSQNCNFNGIEIDLTATEYKLLLELVENRGRVLTKTHLLSQVWGYDAFDPNLVEVHLSSLRKKLNQAGVPEIIRTRRGLGYQAVK
jgi:two-component system OmpR family response regulator